MGDRKGFTLIELLIVIAILGLLAAIAIPNLLNAMDRGKQKRTMMDIRSIGAACEAYSIDATFYPVQTSQADLSALVNVVSPTYIKVLPMVDGWNRSLQYGTPADATAFTLRSLGKDGVKNGVAGPTTDFDCDIVFEIGSFTAWPQGIQRD